MKEGYYETQSYDTVYTKNFVEIIGYLDSVKSVPVSWHLMNQSSSMHYDFNPAFKRVFFNPKSPKYFHSSSQCKKLGNFRKLNEYRIADFLELNESADICPNCMQNDKDIYFIVQFLLDD